MTTIRTAANADWGQALHRAARVTAPLLVLLFVIAADLAALAHVAGRTTGLALAQRSDQLAALFRRLLAPAGPALPPPAPAPAPAAAVQPAQVQAPVLEFEALTQRQLMVLAGTRRKLAKRQLVAMLAAA